VDIKVADDVADDETEEDIEVSEDFEAEDNVNDEENVDAEEGVELAEEEKTELVDCCCSCCWGVGTCLPLYATKSPPSKPPPIAPPNTTSTSANAIQNVRVGSPHMRGVGVVNFGSLSIYSASRCAASFAPCCWYMPLYGCTSNLPLDSPDGQLPVFEAKVPGQAEPLCRVLARPWQVLRSIYKKTQSWILCTYEREG